jgi:hypothetical protein
MAETIVNRNFADAHVPLNEAKSLCKIVSDYVWNNFEQDEMHMDIVHGIDRAIKAIDDAFALLRTCEVAERREVVAIEQQLK